MSIDGVEYRHVKRSASCKSCQKKLLSEKKGGEKAICFYTRTGNGMYIHICKNCIFNFVSIMAEDEEDEVVEDDEG